MELISIKAMFDHGQLLFWADVGPTLGILAALAECVYVTWAVS